MRSTNLQVLLSVGFLIIIHESSADGWWLWVRRRRRRSPPLIVRNCQVGQWSYWSACSHRCGNSGSQWRSRSKTVSELNGGKCNFHLSETQPCNKDVCRQNGATNENGYCVSCKAGFEGTCCGKGAYLQFTIYPF